MANNFVNKIAAGVIKNEMKQLGKEAAKDVGVQLIKDGFSGAYSYFSGSSKKTIEDKIELNNKYDKLRDLLISTTSDFQEYMKGIEEAQGVINLYNLKLDTLSKKNPTYLINKNTLIFQQNRWETLKKSLAVDLTKKLSNECIKVFRTKEASPFFNSHNQINSEIIACKNEDDAIKVNDELYTRYNLTPLISGKGE